MRSSVAGDLNLMIQNGAVNGINAAAMLRDAKAALKGAIGIGSCAQDGLLGADRRCPFGAGEGLESEYYLDVAVVAGQGRGNTHLLQESLDFHADVSVVGTSKGTGGAGSGGSSPSHHPIADRRVVEQA